MTDLFDDSVDDIGRRGVDRRERFEAWREQLRDSDTRFAEASALFGDHATDWHAAVYLLTGCDVAWRRLGARVIGERSLRCVVEALDAPGHWSPRQVTMMRWAAHLADGRRVDAHGFPGAFGEFCFRRWVTAVHLRAGLAPALTILDQRRLG